MHAMNYLLVFSVSRTIQTRIENRDDLEHVLGEIFVKGCITSFVDNDHFHILGFTYGKYKFCAESEQSILLRNNETLHVLVD